MDQTAEISPTLHFTVNKMTGDMQFVGIFYIIIGAIECLTIIGAIIGIPIIICGLRLRESADAFKIYLNTRDSLILERALEREGRFFFIQKVFLIISVVLFVFYIIFIIIFGLTLLSNFHSFKSV